MSETLEDDVYRLAGSENIAGGLIIRKKTSDQSDHTFKKPRVSALGLDKLAEKIRNDKKKKYRSPQEETPTHTGGVNKEAQDRLESRLKRQSFSGSGRNRERDKGRNRSNSRDRDRDRDRKRDHKSSSRDHSSRKTPRFKDEPQTPKFRMRVRKLGQYFS